MLTIIPSKSYAHRAYICDWLQRDGSFFTKGLQRDGSFVICDLDSDDIKATRGCLEVLSGCTRGSGCAPVQNQVPELDCGESGSTLRFLLPLVGALGTNVRFITKGRLSKRPLGELENELEKQGMVIGHPEEGVISASGKLCPGVFRLPGSVSSQYITGLLLALPYLDGDSRIVLTSDLQSAAYVDITIDVLREYGVRIERLDDGYRICGGQRFHRAEPYKVEGDWSQAAFWLAAGAIGKASVSIAGLNLDSVQGDRRIIDVLRSFGARIETEKSSEGCVVTSYPSELTGTIVDISEIPDLAPAIACAAAAASGETRLTHAERLKLKESDRIASVVRCLTDVGIKAEGTDSEIIVHGCCGDKPEGGRAETAGDHRIVMMAAILSLITANKVAIADSCSVRKSYPTFFDELERAGLADNIIREDI